MHTTSISLLERLRQPTDHAAWERFAELYTPLLFYWARRAGLSEHDAAEVVQNVFVVLLQKLPTFQYNEHGTFRGWMRAITMNLWKNRFRRPAPRSNVEFDSRLVSSEDNIADVEAEEYRLYLAGRALQLMKTEFEENTWRACWAQVVDERPAAEIAAELGIREGTVYSAKCRVLKRLREELEGLWEG